MARKKLQRTSWEGVKFIASWEGFNPRPYNDGAGNTGNATIGFGTLLHYGLVNLADKKKWGGGITRKTGLRLMRLELRRVEKAVREAVKVPISQARFDALVSFAYNVGINGFLGSTLLRELNQRHYSEVSKQLMRWTGGPPGTRAGLRRRRVAEGLLFDRGRYGHA